MNLKILSKTRLALTIVIGLTLLVTLVSSIIVYQYAKNQEVESLRRRVSTFALTLDSADINQLSGQASDVDLEPYQNLKTKLVGLKELNPDTRFVYLMGQRGDEIFFLADSEIPESEDYSPPGQTYEEATDILYSAFQNQGPMQEISSDRWGTWLSVFAPIIDPGSGQTVALAGFDMPYTGYLTRIILLTAIPGAAGLILLILLIGAWVVAKKDETLMNIRSAYFSIAAHDLRTPLTGIKWAVGSLKKSDPATLPIRQYRSTLNQIFKASDTMIASVNELLDGLALETGRTKQLTMVPLILQDIVMAAFKPLEINAAEKELNMQWQKPREPITITGDSDKLRRVFANIFSNAIKYSNVGGTITIYCGMDKNHAVVSIADSGIGIPLREQVKIFDGYFRASNAREYTMQGTGLGLYYVKSIISLHGGEVSVTSEPGKGTTITLLLPT